MKSRADDLGISYFIHPLPLATVALMIVNDHYLKRAYPSFLTGKLSDFTGVFFFPIFLCALYNLVRRAVWLVQGRRDIPWITLKQTIVAIIACDLIFVGVKFVPPVTAVYLQVLAQLGFPSRVWPDPTDLAALVMNAATWIYVKKLLNKYYI